MYETIFNDMQTNQNITWTTITPQRGDHMSTRLFALHLRSFWMTRRRPNAHKNESINRRSKLIKKNHKHFDTNAHTCLCLYVGKGNPAPAQACRLQVLTSTYTYIVIRVMCVRLFALPRNVHWGGFSSTASGRRALETYVSVCLGGSVRPKLRTTL